MFLWFSAFTLSGLVVKSTYPPTRFTLTIWRGNNLPIFNFIFKRYKVQHLGFLIFFWVICFNIKGIPSFLGDTNVLEYVWYLYIFMGFVSTLWLSHPNSLNIFVGQLYSIVLHLCTIDIVSLPIPWIYFSTDTKV